MSLPETEAARLTEKFGYECSFCQSPIRYHHLWHLGLYPTYGCGTHISPSGPSRSVKCFLRSFFT